MTMEKIGTVAVIGGLIAIIISLCVTTSAALAAEAVKLSENIYTFSGTTANSAALIGNDGVLLIDSGDNKEVAEQLQAALTTVTAQPVTYLINTHWHYDHVNGNEFFGSNGALILGQSQMRQRAADQETPLPEIALPALTFTDSITLYLYGEEIRIFHPKGAAHTDGDAMVYFRNANILHMGDVYFQGLYPYIDVEASGWIDGIVTAVQEILPLINAETTIIPGHGPVSDKPALEAYAAMLTDISAQVKALIADGKSLEEVQAAAPTKAYDEGWGKVYLTPQQFTELVYQGLIKHQ